MGLDMYLVGDDYIPSFDGGRRPEREGYPVSSYRLDMGYWRKHAPLHCHIVSTYANGVDDCREIPLSEEDLRAIAAALRENALPKDEDCNGFFFGNVILITLAQCDNLAHDLCVVTAAFRFGHHFFLLVCDFAFLKFETLKALDELTQFVCGDTVCCLGNFVHLFLACFDGD